MNAPALGLALGALGATYIGASYTFRLNADRSLPPLTLTVADRRRATTRACTRLAIAVAIVALIAAATIWAAAATGPVLAVLFALALGAVITAATITVLGATAQLGALSRHGISPSVLGETRPAPPGAPIGVETAIALGPGPHPYPDTQHREYTHVLYRAGLADDDVFVTRTAYGLAGPDGPALLIIGDTDLPEWMPPPPAWFDTAVADLHRTAARAPIDPTR